MNARSRQSEDVLMTYVQPVQPLELKDTRSILACLPYAAGLLGVSVQDLLGMRLQGLDCSTLIHT
eukprot:2797725-Amphidinium_carterae.1